MHPFATRSELRAQRITSHVAVIPASASARFSCVRMANTAAANAPSAASSTAAKYWLIKNGEFVSPESDSKALLRSTARGAYTTVRTVNQQYVFEWSFHVNRLATSLALIFEAPAETKSDYSEPVKSMIAAASMPFTTGDSVPREAFHQYTHKDTLRPILEGYMRTGAAAYARARGGLHSSEEVRVTILMTPAASGVETNSPPVDVFMHFSILPPRPKPPVKVHMAWAHRENPLAKDSDWVRQYEQMEAEKPADVNEIVMVGPDRTLLEGLSSNFFAVLPDPNTKVPTVYTAAQGVLPGTVREVAINVCRENGIPVKEEAPPLSSMKEWLGCFISSTSRLVLPIHWCRLPAPDTDVVVEYDYSKEPASIVNRIDQLVAASILKNSERVLF